MPLITWTDDLSVGVEAIDNDHQLLINLINLLHDAVADGPRKETGGSVLNVLHDYTEYHFEREEVLMAACGYPGLEAHRMAHDGMKAKVVEIRDQYLDDPASILGADVLDFLKDWLVTHIKGTDQDFKSHMAAEADAVARASFQFAEKLARMAGERDLDDSLF